MVEKPSKLPFQLILDLEGVAASTGGLVSGSYSFAASRGMVVLRAEIVGNLVRMPEEGGWQRSGMIVDCNLAKWGVLHLLALNLPSSMNG